jgi:hypothetical protein
VPSGLAGTDITGSGPACQPSTQPAVSKTLDAMSMVPVPCWAGSSNSRIPEATRASERNSLPSARIGWTCHTGQTATVVSATASGKIATESVSSGGHPAARPRQARGNASAMLTRHSLPVAPPAVYGENPQVADAERMPSPALSG